VGSAAGVGRAFLQRLHACAIGFCAALDVAGASAHCHRLRAFPCPALFVATSMALRTAQRGSLANTVICCAALASLVEVKLTLNGLLRYDSSARMRHTAYRSSHRTDFGIVEQVIERPTQRGRLQPRRDQQLRCVLHGL